MKTTNINERSLTKTNQINPKQIQTKTNSSEFETNSKNPKQIRKSEMNSKIRNESELEQFQINPKGYINNVPHK